MLINESKAVLNFKGDPVVGGEKGRGVVGGGGGGGGGSVTGAPTFSNLENISIYANLFFRHGVKLNSVYETNPQAVPDHFVPVSPLFPSCTTNQYLSNNTHIMQGTYRTLKIHLRPFKYCYLRPAFLRI